MKRILFVESGKFGGGSFISLKKHIKALDLKKITPVVIFFNQNDLISEFKTNGIKVYLIDDPVFTNNGKFLYLFANALFMKGYLKKNGTKLLEIIHKKTISELINISKKEKIDGIHLNTELFRDRIGLLVGKKLNLPIISHLRSKYEVGDIYFNKEYVRIANSIVSKYIAVSKDTAEFWINKVGVSIDKCQVLYDYYIPLEKETSFFSSIDKENLKFVCVANLVPVKAHDFLLKSISKVLLKYNAMLFLVGKGEPSYIEELKHLANRLGIIKHLKFLGFRNDIPEILESSDIVLLTSKREGLPNILIEAMGMGSIVIATDVGGIPEIIENKVSGFTIEYDNVENATKTIENILNLSNNELLKIKTNAQLKVDEFFNMKKYKKTVLKLYE